MKKILFVIANYSDQRQEFFEQHFSPRNALFAKIHNYEYIVCKNITSLFRNNPTWWKFTIVQEMINSGFLKEGDEVLHLDADMRVDKYHQDYPCDKSFTVAIDNGNTFCMGSYKVKINKWSIELINSILDESLWQKNKHSEHWNAFREQAAFYTLCGILPHSWIPFFWFPNYGWHSKISEDTKYSIKELHKNVQVIGPEWNTTLLDDNIFNIVKSKKEDTIIRHFAGGQQWEK